MIVGVCPKIEKNAFPTAECPVESGKKIRPMAYGTVNGKSLTDKENKENQQHEFEQQEGIRYRAKALALKLARTYEELTKLLERNPAMKRQITEASPRRIRFTRSRNRG
jgi:hypothetical protein